MALCMIMSYGPQASQINEEPPQESSIDLTLTQHPHDEDPKPWEMRLHFEIKPFCIWYYQISLNFLAQVILLQIDPASSNEPETI